MLYKKIISGHLVLAQQLPLSVVSTDPANNAVDVFLNKIVSANFNMLMNHSTINTTTFTLKQGTTSVTGKVTYDGQTAYFDAL